MKKKIIIIISLIIILGSMCIQRSDNQTINHTNRTQQDQLNLTMDIGKTVFISGENVSSTITLENTGKTSLKIQYFPQMPFNAFLYDENGNLLDTYVGNFSLKNTLIKPDILVLNPESQFQKKLNFTLDRSPGKYQLDAGFIGNIENRDNQENNKVLVKLKAKINITIV